MLFYLVHSFSAHHWQLPYQLDKFYQRYVLWSIDRACLGMFWQQKRLSFRCVRGTFVSFIYQPNIGSFQSWNPSHTSSTFDADGSSKTSATWNFDLLSLNSDQTAVWMSFHFAALISSVCARTISVSITTVELHHGIDCDTKIKSLNSIRYFICLDQSVNKIWIFCSFSHRIENEIWKL